MSNSTTPLDQIASNQAAKEVVLNALMDAASPATLWGRHASACSGLTWGYYGGSFVDSTATLHAIANATVTLTASTTNYLYADPTTGAVSANTTGFPAGKVPLYSIVTGTTTVTSYTDYRSYQPSATAGGGGSTPALSALPDVNVTEGAGINGYSLTWNNATSKWVATNVSGGATALSGLSDVNVTEGSAINGYSLTWNNSTSKWVATNISGGSGGPYARVDARNSGGQSIPASTTTTVTGWTVTTDTLSNFNASTGIFTAPATGLYMVAASCFFASGSWSVGTAALLTIVKNSSTVRSTLKYVEAAITSNYMSSLTAQAVVSLTAGDTIKVQVLVTSGAQALYNATGDATENTLSIAQLP